MKKLGLLCVFLCVICLENVKAFAQSERIAFSHSYEISNSVFLNKDYFLYDLPGIRGVGDAKYFNRVIPKGTLIGTISLKVGVTRSVGTMAAGEGGIWGQMYENNLGALTTIQPAEVFAYNCRSGKLDMSGWHYEGYAQQNADKVRIYVANDVVTTKISLEPKNGKNCYIAAWSPRDITEMSGSEAIKLKGTIEKNGKVTLNLDFWGKAAIEGSLGLKDGTWSIGGSINISNKYLDVKDQTSTKNNKYFTTYTFDRKTTFNSCSKERSNLVYCGQTIESSLRWMYNKPNYQYMGNSQQDDVERVFSSSVRFVLLENKNKPSDIWAGSATVSRDIIYRLP